VAETYFDKPLNVHLKIDTGLNRLGIEPKDIEQVVHILKTNRNIIIEGIYSHLASVRENDSIYTKDQIKNFKDAIKNLENAHSGKVIRHLAASGAVIMLKETHFDMVRCGIATYGLFPNQEMREKFPQTDFLVPVLSLKTKIMQIKKVLPGERVSYGGTYVAKKEMLIGILPIGYADGLPRGLSNPGGKGEVLILGERCPIVGRICMNMTIIDISNIKEQISNSDIEVTIIGKDGNKEITADELAQKSDTINHEILARLPEHIVRIFV
jgi:alanine racemase